MGLFSRSVQASITGDAWRRFLAGEGRRTAAGIVVGDSAAERYSAAFGCRRIVSEDVAKIPLCLFRKRGLDRERATDHPLYELLHDRPNAWTTSFHFRETGQGQVEFKGNTYARIVKYGKEIRELIPIDPDTVTVGRNGHLPEYRIAGETHSLAQSEILHVRGYSNDGYVGISTLRAAREAIGLGLVAERHGSQLFGNGARPGLVVEHPSLLDDDAAKRLKEDILSETGGENRGGLLLLEQGTKLAASPITMNSDDAQFLETRKLQVIDVCRFFRVPPSKLQDWTDAKYANVEQQSIDYVNDSLVPRLVRWEAQLTYSLLTAQERQAGFFFAFVTDGLLRADTAARNAAYAIQLQNGIRNPNQVRRLENEPGYEGGDEYRVPANTVPVGYDPREKAA